jgi:predicted regulator of Ras-like GTPase activity (Roadblock/LC7/MglB family)
MEALRKMARTDMVILEEDHNHFQAILNELATEANAKLVFLLDKNGQQITTAGCATDVDLTSLASLASGTVAATQGMGGLIGEPEFSTLFHEGKEDHVHINVVSNRVILLIIFNHESSLGLVRLRVQQRLGRLAEVVEQVMKRTQQMDKEPVGTSMALGDITDDDIDALFG